LKESLSTQAVTIHDSYHLADLLALAGPDALTSEWFCEGVECVGPGVEQLYAATDSQKIEGTKLVALAAGISQTIDGTFEAFLPGEDQPWLVLECIDGCYFVVITRSASLIAEIQSRFKDVHPSPEDAEWYEG
jgi:hypothetical protein